MTSIHAELSGDRGHIVLVAAGESAEEIAFAARRLQTLTPLFSKSDPPGALVTPATWPAVVQLEATFTGGSAAQLVKGPALQSWINEQVARRTATLPTALPDFVHVPAGMRARDYQVAGAYEIARTGSALITDEPRTGKTITTILGVALNAGPEHAEGLPVVVICPASVVDPWVDAFRLWAPFWRTVAWHGTGREKLAGTADVYVTSYDTARMDANEINRPLVELGARTLVVDETHYITNPHTHRTRAVKRLARWAHQLGGSFIGLSGTPITHHPGNWHPTLACLDPDAWPSRERWMSRYCLTLQTDYREEVLGLLPATEPEFRLALLGQHRRVTRAQVGHEIPKSYSVRTVDLPPKWRKVYDDFEAQMYAELPDGQQLATPAVLTKLIHLSALSSAAVDVEVTYGPDVSQVTGQPKEHVHLELKAPSWKVDALLEILDERCGDNGGERVGVFAESAQLVKLAGAAAEKAGYRVGYIVGDQSKGARTKVREAFQAGELDVVCITTSAGGTGITLSAAGTLVFLQRPWSLVQSIQAEDRAEDVESTTSTEIIDVVARNTVDSRRRAVLRERAGQLGQLLQDPRIVAELLGGTGAQPSREEPAA